MSDVIEELQGVKIHELTEEQAKGYVDKLAFHYYGGMATEGSMTLQQTAGQIRSKHAGLCEQAGIHVLTSFDVERAYKREMKRKYSSRTAMASDLIYKNLARLEKAALVTESILDDPEAKSEIKLNAIDRLVSVEKRQAQISGYDAATKVEILAGSSRDAVFTEEDKMKIVEELKDWEQQQFSLPEKIEIVEGGG